MTFPWLVVGVVGTATLAGAFAITTRWYFVAAVAGSAAMLLLQNGYFHYTSDDAYITFRYSRNLADGIGPYWNPGEHVEGYTNFLWMALLAALHKLGADIVPTARWLGFGLAVLCAGGTYTLTRTLVRDEAGRIAGVAAVLLLSASGVWGIWTFAGLESPLVAALVLAAVLLHLRERAGSLLQPSGAVWAFAAMARPEALVLVAVSGAFKLVDPCPERQGRATVLRAAALVAWALPLAALYGAYFGWRFHTYGWLFPNTYYAKVGAGLDQWDRGLRYVFAFVQEYGGWTLLLVPFALAADGRSPRHLAYILSLLLVWGAVVVYVGGDSLLRMRMFAPVLPLFYAAVTAAFARIIDRLDTGAVGRFAAPSMAAALFAGLAMTLYPSATGAGSVYALPSERAATAERVAYGRWLREHLPADTSVALVAAGALAYESRLPAIDMLGLSDEHIAHRDVPLGSFPAGHEKYDAEYVLDRRPDIILLRDTPTDEPWRRTDYLTSSSALIPAVPDMLSNPRLWADYEPRSVRAEDGRWRNMLVRRDAQLLLAMTQPVPE